MEDKFSILKVIDASSLELAFIRSMLRDHYYIEFENYFIISCSKNFKDGFSESLKQENIYFIFIYVNLKSGCEVFSFGINDQDNETIKNIIEDYDA